MGIKVVDSSTIRAVMVCDNLFPEVRNQLKGLFNKVSIQKAPSCQGSLEVHSHFFVVDKKDSGRCPTLDLRALNIHVSVPKFRMVTLPAVIEVLSQGQWLVVPDLKDIYFHFSIHQDHKKYFWFRQGNDIYECTVLAFGLATAPRVFTKCMAVAIAYLRTKGYTIFPYLNDWLVVVCWGYL